MTEFDQQTDPREGDETEIIERDGDQGSERLSAPQGSNGPRPGDATEPLEEGDRLTALAASRLGDRTESAPHG